MRRRHTLLWLSRPPRAEVSEDSRAVNEWHDAGRPFVLCRDRHERPGELSLGFCGPRASDASLPRRVGARADEALVLRSSPPPGVGEVSGGAGTWAGVADRLGRSGLEFRVVGSWMWSWLADGDDRYLGAQSDLDLVVEVGSSDRAAEACELLRECGDLGLALDCELAAPAGEVHWKEFESGAGEVLCKRIEGPVLIEREALWN